MSTELNKSTTCMRVTGALRIMGFLGSLVFLIPLHIFWGWYRPKEPYRLPQALHRMIVRMLGLHVRVHGALSPKQPVLIVSNHTSYLDIPILGSLIPGAFVAKAEVANWPLFGFLAKLQHTVFIERRTSVIDKYRDDMQERMKRGENLILFPEGTSTDGLSVLPFKSGLFSAVENEAAAPNVLIQPVSISVTALDGLPITRARRPFYAWYGDMTLEGHLWNVFKRGRFTIDVVFHQAISPRNFLNRKALASYCQQEVARGIEQCLTGRGIVSGETEKLKRLPAPA